MFFSDRLFRRTAAGLGFDDHVLTSENGRNRFLLNIRQSLNVEFLFQTRNLKIFDAFSPFDFERRFFTMCEWTGVSSNEFSPAKISSVTASTSFLSKNVKFFFSNFSGFFFIFFTNRFRESSGCLRTAKISWSISSLCLCTNRVWHVRFVFVSSLVLLQSIFRRSNRIFFSVQIWAFSFQK